MLCILECEHTIYEELGHREDVVSETNVCEFSGKDKGMSSDCPRKVNESRTLYVNMEARGIKRGALENIILTGKISGRRGRCRHREMILHGLRLGIKEHHKKNWWRPIDVYLMSDDDDD